MSCRQHGTQTVLAEGTGNGNRERARECIGCCRYRTVYEGVVRGPPLPENGTGPIPDDSFNLWPGR